MVRPTTHELSTQVNEANEVLSDAARRAVYDAEQARAAAPAPAPDSQKRRKAPPKRKASKKRKAPRDDDDFIADSDEEEDSEEESEEETYDDFAEEPARPPPRAPPKRRAPPKTGLEALTVAQLKAKCEAKGLKVSGTKGVLISRLEDAERGVYDRAARAHSAGSAAARRNSFSATCRTPARPQKTIAGAGGIEIIVDVSVVITAPSRFLDAARVAPSSHASVGLSARVTLSAPFSSSTAPSISSAASTASRASSLAAPSSISRYRWERLLGISAARRAPNPLASRSFAEMSSAALVSA